MSDGLEDAGGDELSMVGFLPEDLPFEIDKGSKEEDDDAENDGREEWCWYGPYAVECGEWPDHDHEYEWCVVDDKECSEGFWWSVVEHSCQVFCVLSEKDAAFGDFDVLWFEGVFGASHLVDSDFSSVHGWV